MILAISALILSYAVAIVAWLVLRRTGTFSPAVAGAWSAGVTACSALAYFDEEALVRALTFVCGALVGLRVYSYCLAGRPAGFADFLRFLSVGMLSPHLVYSPARRRLLRVSFPLELLRMAVAGGTIAAISWLAMYLIFDGPGRDSRLANHLIVVAAFVIVMTAFGQASLALWRMMGLRARPVVDRIWLARTPADFWRRWSWPIHLWLYRYIYVPCGGRRWAVASVLAVFTFSAVLHEVLAFVAIGRITGHQSAFFGVSAAGVLASPMLERIGRLGVVGEVFIRTVTLTFLAATAALMFVTIDALIPLYATRSWLMW
jgi:hypothetical protein